MDAKIVHDIRTKDHVCWSCKWKLVLLAIGILHFATLRIPRSYFCFPPNLNAHPTFGSRRFFFTTYQHQQQITKDNGRVLDSWMVVMWLESLPFHIFDLEY